MKRKTTIDPTVLTIEQADVTTLKHHPKNARRGDVDAIKESLEAHGQYKPLIVQKSTRRVLAGNHTLKAAKELGWTSLAVTFVDVSDDQALRILLVDNRTNDLASYDDQALADLLSELAATTLSFEGTGFDGDDLDQLLADLAAVPPPAESRRRRSTRCTHEAGSQTRRRLRDGRAPRAVR